MRVNRVERLETRHMLSADGLSVDHFHDDFAEQLSRASHSYESSRGSEIDLRGPQPSQTGRASGDLTLCPLRDDLSHHTQTQDRSGFNDGRRESADRSFGRAGHQNPSLLNARAANATVGEGELIANNIGSLGSPPPPQFEPTTTPAPIASSRLPITSSRITFVIFLPSVSPGASLDNGVNRSATDAPGGAQAAPQPTPADTPTAGSQLPRNSEQARTPTGPAARQVEQAVAVQLVSVRQRDDFFAAATAIDAVVGDLHTNVGGSPKLDFSFEALRFGDTPLEELMAQKESLADSFTELEELLEAISLERAESMHHRDNAIPPMIPTENQADAIVKSPSQQVPDGMILLLPGASLTNPVIQLYDRLDDSAISQWTVGVGFYRALEIVGDSEFADALIASELAIKPIVSAASQSEAAEVATWRFDPASSSHQAAGIVFCCLGIQYLRNRKKETDHTAVARPSISRGEEMVD